MYFHFFSEAECSPRCFQGPLLEILRNWMVNSNLGNWSCFFANMFQVRHGVLDILKIWSSHLLDNLSNCLMNLKNPGDSTGFEPMTSAMPVQCSNQLSPTELWSHTVESRSIRWAHVFPWKECHMKEMLYAVRCLKSNEDMILALAGQLKQLSHEPEKFRWLNGIRTLQAQLVRALHRHRRGHGFESRWVTWIFQVHETIA